MQRGEGAGRKPAALLLRLEVFQEVIDFFFADRFAQRHKEIRGDQVAVEFRNFVLEDPVVSERRSTSALQQDGDLGAGPGGEV